MNKVDEAIARCWGKLLEKYISGAVSAEEMFEAEQRLIELEKFCKEAEL